MNSSQVRTRFAPSPTGYLHVGGARTALFNWLFAKKHGGSFVLRVEDTDQERNTEEARQAIFEGMEWLGLDWQEGPCADGSTVGEYGPYYQSQRNGIYDKWFDKLFNDGRVYEDDGAWRFRFDRKEMTMQDLICGEVIIDYREESNTPDMVVKRSDGSYMFHFVNVVDDLEMKISHVIRGEDHLMNTPKHIQLFEAFGITPPLYGHIPLILNKDGSKMSKRDTGAALGEYSKDGFTANAVFNFLTLLGWSPKDESEIMPISEIIERFSIDGINRSPAKFDSEKCTWINQQHIMNLTVEEFADAASPYLEKEGLEKPESYLAIMASVQEKVRLLNEVPAAIAFYLNSDFDYSPESLEKVRNNDLAKALLTKLSDAFTVLEDWSEAKNMISSTAKENGAKPGQLMFPTRVALSGQAGGPDLGAILEILGKEDSIYRIKRTISQL